MITGEGQDALFLLEKSVARWTGHRNPTVRVDAERKCLLIEVSSYINRIFTGIWLLDAVQFPLWSAASTKQGDGAP